jgi:hypothetical protein
MSVSEGLSSQSDVTVSDWKLRMVYFDADGYPMLHKEPDPEDIREAFLKTFKVEEKTEVIKNV